MKARVLFVALIALFIATGSNGFVYAGDKEQEQKQLREEWIRNKKEIQKGQKELFKQLAAILWAKCRLVLDKRGVQAPEHGPEIFGQVHKYDIGKEILTTAGPVSSDRQVLEKFISCLQKKDYEKAAAIMDDRELRWLKSGVKAELVTLIGSSIAVVRPPGATNIFYTPIWSVKPTE